MDSDRIRRCFYCHDEMADLELCEECHHLFCDECAPCRDDDAPITLCLDCCEPQDTEGNDG